MTEVLEITQPGLLATLQDFGRFGHQAQGVTEGGPMDERAFLWANRLLGNSYNAAQIEITLGQFKAKFRHATLFVVTGAEFPLSLNGNSIKSWRVYQAQAGDTLSVGHNDSGLRSYLAVSGGFRAEPVLGSVATVVRDGLGGLQQQGKPLAKGDVLAAEAGLAKTLESRRPSSSVVTAIPSRPVLDLIPAGQIQQFSSAARELLVGQTYQVTNKQDRMGVRLQGQQPLPQVPASMISEPLPMGSVQVPADGQPIVMMNDHQTLGGYPKIGVLSWTARSILAQLPAGRKFQFRWLELAEAQRELRQVWRFFNVMR
ncbi:biotin-dependent carboxyltransferase family protein [Pseudidiomarina terrestris]|uniref:5-oxoprolinase subunit C family protein n=1 Tax=Pseudidiomarina terrestris TaxID=2820060 RepID=UPI002655AEC7|nr:MULTISPECIES: biotin-dependent carboxyltransferase family protein [unclassified Pseudidiomarina]MDN7135435.1 biotin-dependent carboxyltransferase family protein [Pseudidiomarina sp. 1ASP75-5]MDN7138533.1 biotin-dependent carboxyltransferase family protein [Pseudidiomarina sp. 1ASP75-14]